MKKYFIFNTLRRIRTDTAGVTLVEYGVALVLAVLVGATALTALGGAVNTQIGAAEASL